MIRALLLAVVLASAAPAARSAEIRLWHAMAGAQGAALEALAARFNASQTAYRVVPVYQGGFLPPAVLAGQPEASAPHLVQVDDARTAELLARPGSVRPLWEVMAQARQPIELRFAPALAAQFSDAQGRLLALPLGASTPVLYYNSDAFRRARLDPAPSLRTWYQMADALGALIEAGAACGFTAASPSWVLLENMSAWHNEPFALEDGVADPRLTFNGRLMVRWVAMLASWRKSGYFSHAGGEDEAESRFAAGECAVLTSSSASYGGLQKRSPFGVAVAPLPYYDDFSAAPQNTLVRGAGLWVVAGRAQKDYAGVARFIAFLSRADVQAEWHQKTGYIPLMRIAYELTRAQGFYLKHPGHEVAVRQVMVKVPTDASRAMRLGQLPRIRSIIDEELESAWGGRKSALDSLNSAVARGNALLRTSATLPQ
jgi:sn-glycerol 3-phosphate transport system substrate-binding protein